MNSARERPRPAARPLRDRAPDRPRQRSSPEAAPAPATVTEAYRPAVPPGEIRPVTLIQPGRILFGDGCAAALVDHLAGLRLRRALVVTSSPVLDTCRGLLAALEKTGLQLIVHSEINTEPTVAMFEACVKLVRRQTLDGVIGLGGGSAMDVAKLVAALADGSQSLAQVFGINLLKQRSLYLVCVPTTAGTGSEVSPNAILLDESCQLKKAVISPHLVPDLACVDPLLTHSAPPAVTAATGLDALTHCIEAYANRYAHPVVDLYALEGVRLIAPNLLAALADGRDAAARARLALGSLYGGLCLGPVNTAAVHALAYPLGSEFSVAHGVSNALLLPHVLRFNLSAAPDRYANIALALGVEAESTTLATAEKGVIRLAELLNACPIPRRIGDLGVPRDALPRLVRSAMTVTRLLNNNPREVSEAAAEQIYLSAF